MPGLNIGDVTKLWRRSLGNKGVKEFEELFSLLSKTTLHVYTSRFYVNFSAVSNMRNFNLNWTNVQVL